MHPSLGQRSSWALSLKKLVATSSIRGPNSKLDQRDGKSKN